jgi:chromate transporter
MAENDSRLPPSDGVTFREALWVWCRIAALSFGGPTAQIAVMHRILVDEKKWISENRFLHALNYCMLIPGPEATQLATYIGWLLHGTLGGIVAGTLFVLPGFAALMALSIVYAVYAQTPLLAALFFGLKPAVAAIVAEAVLRIGSRVLKNSVMAAIAAAAFIAIFFFHAPFPAIIAVAGMLGLVGSRVAPEMFHVIKQHADADGTTRAADRAAAGKSVSLTRTIGVAAFWLAVWWAPVGVLAWRFGWQSVFVTEGLFFSQAAVVTFGGAYSVLPYISQAAVHRFRWLTLSEMLDGLGMAETTPGPLIMVVQFVGFMAAFRNPGELAPLAAGALGACITVWVTFLPCFLWIFVGAPYVERMHGSRVLSSALSAVTAAVVGVVLNLAVWFALQTLFPSPGTATLESAIPRLENFSPASLLIASVAGLLLFGLKRGMFVTLGMCVALGMVLYAIGTGR